MIDKNNLLAKFGRLEHLELLSEGYVYLNPVSKYRTDESIYRGDSNEGSVPIDPSKINIKNQLGQNIFEFLPQPSNVKLSWVDDKSTLMFCASMITKEILIENNGQYRFSEKYKDAIKDFGDYVLLFSSGEFLSLLNKARLKATPEFGYTSGPIIYRDLEDFSDVKSYHEAYYSTGSVYDPFFVKSDKYRLQNEWRLIVDGSYASLPTNDDAAYTIRIDKLGWAHLFDTRTFLDTFNVTDD